VWFAQPFVSFFLLPKNRGKGGETPPLSLSLSKEYGNPRKAETRFSLFLLKKGFFVLLSFLEKRVSRQPFRKSFSRDKGLL